MDPVLRVFLIIVFIWFAFLGMHFYFIPIEKIKNPILGAIYIIVYLKYGLFFLSMFVGNYIDETFFNTKNIKIYEAK